MAEIEVVLRSDILFRKWISSDSQRQFVLVHGMGAHSQRWEYLAQWFRSRNTSCYAIELKGFGETKTISGHIESFDIYYRDFDKIIEMLQITEPDQPVYLIGESLGGLLIYDYLHKNNVVDGVCCLSPAFKNKMKFSFRAYLMFFWYLITNPWRTIKMPFTDQMLTRDELIKEQLHQDDRESRDVSAQMLWEILKAQLRASRFARKVKIPVQFILGGNDKMVDIKHSKRIYNKIKSTFKELKVFPEMEHALSIEQNREDVFQQIFDFVQKIEDMRS